MAVAAHDVIVAGLGAMGSATAAHLALRGRRVLGLERWEPGHPYGSSHGDSRIIREMYFEHPMYVPLVQRAYELWRELEERTGRSLMHIHGGLMIGPRRGVLVSGTLRSAETHGLAYELLDGAAVQSRFPEFRIDEDEVAVLDRRGGWVDPEACNRAHLDVALLHGAELRFEEPVVSWVADGDGIRVTTPAASYLADSLVLCAGARTSSLLNGLELPLEVERQAVFWLDPGGDEQRFDPSRFPIYAREYLPGEICYGFPMLARGVKASVMHAGEIVSNADDARRDVDGDDLNALRSAMGNMLPGLAHAPVRGTDACLFTNTPDHDFILDFHPRHSRVVVSSACSGHGFKFASAIGEIQADLVTEGRSKFDLEPFRIARFPQPTYLHSSI